jgi:hypothetical protein
MSDVSVCYVAAGTADHAREIAWRSGRAAIPGHSCGNISDTPPAIPMTFPAGGSGNSAASTGSASAPDGSANLAGGTGRTS